MTQPDDAELIQAVLDGSDAAFAGLMDRYEERVFRLLSRFTRDRAAVEDLSQEVFVKVFRKLDSFQQDSSLYTWIYRIAVNTANDHLGRKGRHKLRLVGEDEVLEAGGEQDSDQAITPLLDAERREVTREIVDSLSEKYRTVLLLREYEDLSYTEISEVLGISIGTVESRLFRARQRFKEALERRYPDLVPGGQKNIRGTQR